MAGEYCDQCEPKRTKYSSATMFKSKFIILTVLFAFVPSVLSAGVGLTGSHQTCKNEGEVFPLPGSIENPCFTCLCKGGHVECEKQQCPNLQGCYLIMPGVKQGCCEVCKGCKLGNTTYPSGSETVNGCQKTTCMAGVLTTSKIQCYTPCDNPVPPKPGECCPTCDKCSLNGKEYNDGEEIILGSDPCVHCKCSKGSITCQKNACPVLSCPPSATILEKGACCPKCTGKRTRYVPKNVCLLGAKAYPDKTTFRLDTCTNCTCVDNTAVCDRIACPPVDCDPIHQIYLPGACCPKCAEPEPKQQCLWNDAVFDNGEFWDVNSCRSCYCDWGKVRCTEHVCPKLTSCPYGQKLITPPGQCCQQCVAEQTVCTVSGTSNYRTFDGLEYTYNGTCKYVLAADCLNDSFSVRIQNGKARGFWGGRTITVTLGEDRITLAQKMGIKVNGKKVSLPSVQENFSIYQDDYKILLKTGSGIKLRWDGDTFIQIAAHHSIGGRLCGLCGNFNGNKSDDQMTRNGVTVDDSNKFANSWKVGGAKSCVK